MQGRRPLSSRLRVRIKYLTWSLICAVLLFHDRVRRNNPRQHQRGCWQMDKRRYISRMLSSERQAPADPSRTRSASSPARKTQARCSITCNAARPAPGSRSGHGSAERLPDGERAESRGNRGCTAQQGKKNLDAPRARLERASRPVKAQLAISMRQGIEQAAHPRCRDRQRPAATAPPSRLSAPPAPRLR